MALPPDELTAPATPATTGPNATTIVAAAAIGSGRYFLWDAAANYGHGGYIEVVAGTGARRQVTRVVSTKTVRIITDAAIDAKVRNIGQLAEGLRAGVLSLAEWQTAMMQELKDIHLISAALNRGGWANMTQSDFGRVGRIVRDEYAYLRNFANDIAAGNVPLDGRFVRRAQLYGEAGRDTFYNFASVYNARLGFDEIASVLHARESCPECIDHAGRGFVPISELGASFRPIGSRQCLSRCKCSYIYRRTADGETIEI